MARVFDVDLEVVGITPRIWRRVRVPAAATLPDLHHVIQAVMNWEDYHLHLFEVAGREYGVPPEEDWEQEAWDGADEAKVKLSQALADGGGAFHYVYDFGDDWRLAVTLVDDRVIPGTPKAECLAGERAAPPEDVGGPSAYQALTDAWARTGRRGLSKELREWLPRRFDPESFDLAAINERLRAGDLTEASATAAPTFADADEQLVADVTLLALHLGSWEETNGRWTAWKTLRFEVLEVLKREGLIETTPARKSVVITDQGIRRAHQLRQRLASLIGDTKS
jgi:hypothetical protein